MNKASGACGMILVATNFYAEQGGQTFDTGKICNSDGSAVFRVDNVQVYGGFVLHLGEVVKGEFKPEDEVVLTCDYTRRLPAASNHTFTHVLNFALRKVLVGEEYGKEGAPTIDQKGSLCDAEKARFDFSWNGPVSVDQLAAVEKICQEHITNGRPVRTQNAPLAIAKEVQTIRAVFGEKYPDPVRIVSIGHETIDSILAKPTDALWDEYSIEFCGGTHLANTEQGEQVRARFFDFGKNNLNQLYVEKWSEVPFCCAQRDDRVRSLSPLEAQQRTAPFEHDFATYFVGS